jgi:hypothetical protein
MHKSEFKEFQRIQLIQNYLLLLQGDVKANPEKGRKKT